MSKLKNSPGALELLPLKNYNTQILLLPMWYIFTQKAVYNTAGATAATVYDIISQQII